MSEPPADTDPADVARQTAALIARMDRVAKQTLDARGYITKAAHELMTPLANLRGELELALRRPRDPGSYRATLRTALDQTNDVIRLAEDLLTLTSARMRDTRNSPAPLSMRTIVDQAVNASLARSRAAVEVRVDVEEVSFAGRGGDLARMVRNLVDNAVQHAPPATRVDIVGRRMLRDEAPREWVELSIRNQGPDIPEPVRERIFEPFFRANVDSPRVGAGLGLAIAREIASAHGGTLTLEPDVDETRFVVRLPIRLA